MATLAEQAASHFNGGSGFNCAQSVFAVFCEKYGLSQEIGLRIAGGLGGGFRSGEVCGAVSGAVLVIGLKHGQFVADDLASKRHCYARTEEFMRTFREKYGSIICRDILGCDITSDEGRRCIKDNNLFGTVCTEKIRAAVSLLEQLGY